MASYDLRPGYEPPEDPDRWIVNCRECEYWEVWESDNPADAHFLAGAHTSEVYDDCPSDAVAWKRLPEGAIINDE